MQCLGVSKGSVAGEKRHKTGQEDHISTAGWPLGLFFVGHINELFLSWLCVSGFPKARAGSAHGPRDSHAPLGIPPSHPRRWFRFGAFLRTFVLACWGIPAPKGQNNGFSRPGRYQRDIGPEGCGPGPPNEHFGWPHRWFGRAQHFCDIFQNVHQ